MEPWMTFDGRLCTAWKWNHLDGKLIRWILFIAVEASIASKSNLKQPHKLALKEG